MKKNFLTKLEPSIRLRYYFLGSVALWSILIGLSLAWNLRTQKSGILEAARIEARAGFDKDIVYRRWNAASGGVYTPVTEVTQPNPYLDVRDRDITTSLGKELTKINPAYMTRQVHELALKAYGIRSHITSLDPIRPANAPDPWETRALKAFQTGLKEASSVEEIEGSDYMRLMRPLLTEQSCLKCHAAQEYKLGDIRGGISVSTPMAPFMAIAQSHILALGVGHSLLWLAGLVGIGLGFRRLNQQIHKRIGVEVALWEKRYDLDERVKDLNCLYGISNLVDNPGISLEEILQGTVNLIPPSWQYPAITCSRIILESREYRTTNFKKTSWGQVCDIKVHDQPIGKLEVYYLEEKPESHEGPFLKEERSLINAVAERLGKIVEHRQSEEALRKAHDELEQRVRKRTSELANANDGLKQEINERRQAEEALRASVLSWDTTFDAITDSVCLIDVEGKILQCNKATANFLGKPINEIVGNTCWELVHGTLEPIKGCPIVRMLETLRPESLELAVGDRVLYVATDPIFDQDGNVAKVVHAITDITDRKQAEKALRESEERFRTVADFTNDWEYWIAPDGHHIYVSPSCERVTGYSPEEFINDHELLQKIVHPDDQSAFVSHICQVEQKTERFALDFRIITRSGEERWISHACQPVYGSGGNYLGQRASNRDITRQKFMQEELLKTQKTEAIATLAGGIAHQFNNALSSITGYTGFLEMDYPQDEKIAEYTGIMKESAHRMTHLTDQLLAYARGGKYNAEIQSPNNFVKDTLALLRHTLDPSVHVETDLPLDVMNIKADGTQMQMMLSAIVANSNEAMEGPGRIRISTRNMDLDQEFMKDHPELKPGPYVCLTIKDDGKGMDEDTRGKIFDPFFTTHFMGRGLGMASVYGIIKNHDGTITVESEVGKGTVVRIYLPAIEAKEEVKKEVGRVELAMGEGTILVIEDEESLVMMFRQILERLGYRVLEAMTGKEAVELANSFDGQIDLALLDIKLPDMDGGRIYPLIVEARPDLKVLVCSGYSIDGPAQAILDAGAEGFIQKPFLIAPFAEKLKEVLEGK